MGQYEKLLRQIENNPSDVTFDDLHKLLTHKKGGFLCRTGKGDHCVFYHPDLPVMLTVDSRGKKGKLKPIYVKQALKLYHQVHD